MIDFPSCCCYCMLVSVTDVFVGAVAVNNFDFNVVVGEVYVVAIVCLLLLLIL